MSIKPVYQIQVLQLRNHIVDIARNGAIPGRFRALHCGQLADNERRLSDKWLCIYEFADFPPPVQYSALSYVWRGNPVRRDMVDSLSTFNAAGAEDTSDPIGFAALYHACSASLLMGLEWLWFDRLCIVQTDRDDKALQIQRMAEIYRRCDACIVLPGGLLRLMSLQEETAWIHRAWTLQEALSPPKVWVVFEWQRGTGQFYRCQIEEVVWRQSAKVELGELLLASIGRDFGTGELPVRFLAQPAPKIIRAVQGSATAGLAQDARAQVVALWGAMKLRGVAREQAIWRSALMRTSSRPVDMVFSIMGLFDVSLDPRHFHVDDRWSVTRDLAKELLRRDGTASWLGVSFYLPPSPQLSTFPMFPQTSPEGRAKITTGDGEIEVAGVINKGFDDDWWLADLPKGSMDEQGYFRCWGWASPTVLEGDSRDFYLGFDNMRLEENIIATDRTTWMIPGQPQWSPTTPPGPRRLLIRMGTIKPFNWEGRPWWADSSTMAVIIEEHAPGKFFRKTSCILGDVFGELMTRSHGWGWRELSIG
ncbi:hypothetical protein B0H21DRAFT_479603 [Amylocystis lapponica]|nr:hypothetical protein B0H21DRAFT_479603 [Amylocystis lapponica]